jgi:hypothetical protein
MKLGCASVGLGFLAVHPCHLGVGCGRRFALCLALVVECPGRTVSSLLLTFEGSLVKAPIMHRRSIAPVG